MRLIRLVEGETDPYGGIVSCLDSMTCAEGGRPSTNKSESWKAQGSDWRIQKNLIDRQLQDGQRSWFLASEEASWKILQQWNSPTSGVLIISADPMPHISGMHTDPDQLVLACARIRDLCAARRIHDEGIQSFPSFIFQEEGTAEATIAVMEACRRHESLIVLIDLNSIEPSSVPEVNRPSPGGLAPAEFLHLIRKISLLPNLRGGCLTGLDLSKEIAGSTAMLAAACLSELA